MNARLLRGEPGGGRSWFEWIRADGVQPQLMSALFDVVGEVASREEYLAASDSSPADRASRARELHAIFTSPAVGERVRAIEDRLIGTVFGPPELGLAPDLDARDRQHRTLVEAGSSDRISTDEAGAAAIGKALIGESRSKAWLPVVHDAAILKAGGTWRKLPVGCLVLESARKPEMAIVGESSIEPDPDADESFVRAPVSAPRRRPSSASEPAVAKAVN